MATLYFRDGELSGRLTDEQRQLAADHYHLAGWADGHFAQFRDDLRRVVPTELLDTVGHDALLLAAASYEAGRGRFSTFFATTYFRQLLRMREHYRRVKRRPVRAAAVASLRQRQRRQDSQTAGLRLEAAEEVSRLLRQMTPRERAAFLAAEPTHSDRSFRSRAKTRLRELGAIA